MNFHVRIPGGVFRHALDRVGGETRDLEALIVKYVTQYAYGETAQQRAAAVTNGQRTREERSAAGRAAVASRWARRNASTSRESMTAFAQIRANAAGEAFGIWQHGDREVFKAQPFSKPDPADDWTLVSSVDPQREEIAQ